ncbi:3D domain-containing protein [Patescibacteria group bacterium]|nr:3D domain-containing protein [Patescibacteria group bacterium]MBU1612809.1 3D domain-containing protein [Patescibacteria group bacterium]
MKKHSKKTRKKKQGKLGRFLVIRFGILIILLVPCVLVIKYYPEADPYRVLETKEVIATAYSSSVSQTDDSPCITANGFDVCANGKEEIIANNHLKMGTKVRIPELYGDRIFTVSDRMNRRYGEGRIDIWMSSYDRAVEFGVKKLKIEVVEEVEK